MPSNLNFRKVVRRVHILPSLLTLGNFACGFFSIILCLNSLFFHTRALMLDTGAKAVAPYAQGIDESGGIGDGERRSIGNDDAGKGERHTFSGASARARRLLFWACVIVFLGMLFDVLDGRVARQLKVDSPFGAELDSLADIATFGIAPPVIVTTLWIGIMPLGASWWGQVMIFGGVYAACAALRLARYNVEVGIADKNIFKGLPSPAAAGCVVTAVLVAEGNYAFVTSFCDWLSYLFGDLATAADVKTRLLGAYLLFIGFLMVTTIPFSHLANRYLRGRRSFALLVVAVFLLALIWHEPRLMLFALFNGYMLAGLLAAARKRLFGQRKPPESLPAS